MYEVVFIPLDNAKIIKIPFLFKMKRYILLAKKKEIAFFILNVFCVRDCGGALYNPFWDCKSRNRKPDAL
jgi:hypothetical protein